MARKCFGVEGNNRRENSEQNWWRWRDLNPHGAKLRQILSLLRLPVPPHRHAPNSNTTRRAIYVLRHAISRRFLLASRFGGYTREARAHIYKFRRAYSCAKSRKFRVYELGTPPQFQKFVCGKKLYNYDALEPSERKLVL